MVEAVRPPMLTSASPWVVEPLSPNASAMGTMATTVVRDVYKRQHIVCLPFKSFLRS